MYLFYVDESGNRDPTVKVKPGTNHPQNWLYVLTAVGVFEHKWKGFYRAIVKRKRELIARIRSVHGIELDLDSAEIKSNSVRIPKQRDQHPFLSRLTEVDITALVALYYEHLEVLKAPVISVAIDKRHLKPGFTGSSLHAKAWEYLVERVEMFMGREHPRHQAVLVADDMGRQENCALAMRHARFLEKRTSSNNRLAHVVEMPLFVRSELSEGVQLADLCGYSIYRALFDGNLEYEFFKPVLSRIYSRPDCSRPDGMKIFPNDSPLRALFEPKEKGSSGEQPELPLED